MSARKCVSQPVTKLQLGQLLQRIAEFWGLKKALHIFAIFQHFEFSVIILGGRGFFVITCKFSNFGETT